MDLGPTLRAMSRNKLRFGLIAAQIAATLAIVANCVALFEDARRKMSHPSAFEENDQILIDLKCDDTALQDSRRRSVWARENLERLRGIPGVRAVASTTFRPFLMRSGWELKAAGSSAGMTGVAGWTSDDQLPAVFDPEIDEGRWFSREEVERSKEWEIANGAVQRERRPDGKVLEPRVSEIVISRAVGQHLFGDGPLLGKMLEDVDGDLYRIVGVMRRYHAPNAVGMQEEYAAFVPGTSQYECGAWFAARAEPGQAADVARRIEDDLSKTFDFAEKSVWLLSDGKDMHYGPQQMTVALMGILVFLLLFVASLGVAGLTSFLVTARIRQIGIRRALGATTGDILRHFLTESGLLTVTGLAIGAGLAVALNIVLLRVYTDAKLDPLVVAGSALVLFLVGLGAALPPALRASRTSPAVAAKNV